MSVPELKSAILEYLEKGHVTFVELCRDLPGFGGDHHAMVLDEWNIVLWDGMTPDGIEALRQLMNEKLIYFAPTPPLVYLIDGAMLKLPHVKRMPKKRYVKEHWLPVTIRLKAA